MNRGKVDGVTRRAGSRQEIAALRARLQEAEEIVQALTRGEVDAIVRVGPAGEQVFTLKGADQPYRLMVETMSEGALTLALDGAILYCNQPFAAIVQHDLEQVIGSSMQKFIAAGDIDKFDMLVQKSQTATARAHMELLRPNGARVPVLISMGRLHTEGIQGIIAVVADLSELSMAEHMRDQLARIVESAQVGIIGMDLDGMITSWNHGAELIYGYTAAETVGQHIKILESPGHKDSSAALIARVRRGMAVGNHETQRLRKDGKTIDVELTLSPVTDSAGTLQGISKIVYDITPRKRIEEEIRRHRAHLEETVTARTADLAAANRELESFSYSVSHDLRAPLRAIDGYSNILLEDYRDKLDAEGQRLLGLVRENAQKMSELINDVLEFSRTGRRELAMEPIDMAALVREVYADLAPELGSRAAELKLGTLPAAQGDRAAIRQVLANLLGNAIKFTRERAVAVIEVEGRTEAAENVYSVSDNGVGFDPQYAHKLFGLFECLHGAEYEGTGVGLAIVKRIVDKHGGHVSAETRPEGGARFCFSLPHSSTATAGDST